jgi:hypothetical protein
MDLTIREIYMICGMVAGLATVWTSTKRDIKANSSSITKLSDFFKKVVLGENGEIRLMDKETFKQEKIELKQEILEAKQTTAEVSNKLTEVNENIILIMYHLNIDMENKKIKGLKRE